MFPCRSINSLRVVLAAVVALILVLNALSLVAQDAAQSAPILSNSNSGLVERLAAIDDLVAAGIADGKMPGCVVCVGRKNEILLLKAYGNKRLVPSVEPMTIDTVFDMASITKPVATATSVMQLIEQGKLSLSVKVATIFPAFAQNEKENITIQDLLLHRSGLIPDNAMSDYLDGPAKAWDRICELKLVAPVGTAFKYSDVNFIVLGKIVEHISGRNLLEYSRNNLFEPLGMKHTGFLPSAALRAKCAPTEQREGRWMQGEVHDPRAFALGGIAGHAGLFSTADDIALFAQMMLRNGTTVGTNDQKPTRILSQASVATMTQGYEVPGGIRGLGWDKRTSFSINRGDFLSPLAFGHGGFTGNVLWIDPELDLFFVFLSNRVHPTGKGLVNPLAGKIANVIAATSFRGSLPPKPTFELTSDQITTLKARLAKLTRDFADVKKHPCAADADIFLKAVRYAIEFHEWYGKKPEDDLNKATALLDEAAKRINSLKENETPWMDGSGQKVLGFYSKIDDSPQPYGVEVPEGLVFGTGRTSVPMWIWLHGRGDTDTDMHFVFGRLNAKKPGQFQPKGTIVIHPFGRYCNGWKSAGETDVFEARHDAIARFNIDRSRIALAGFSMGGAGAWHIGAHFADQWACVHTGAGFVDVKRYQKVTPERMPCWFEQKLWGVYDVPNYARNFHNVPLICYSGEIDPQRDSAEYMAEVLDKEGLHPPHLIGPGMGHKYHPEVIKEVQLQIEKAVAVRRDALPKKLILQTRTLAYSRAHWLQIIGIREQWEDARVEAKWDDDKNEIRVTTKNVTALTIQLPAAPKLPNVWVDEVEVPGTTDDRLAIWNWNVEEKRPTDALFKRPMLQGPIDDGFKSRFILVLPDGLPDGTASDKWARIEADHFLVRWRSLMRGDAMVRTAKEVTEKDIQDCHLVVWGTPNTNTLMRKILASPSLIDVITWDDQVVRIGEQQGPSASSVPVLCFPNPLNPSRYVIVNSGLTFREVHDKTNSLQNPKLPDWAILDIAEPPSIESAGRVIAADFFDSQWKVQPRVKLPENRE